MCRRHSRALHVWVVVGALLFSFPPAALAASPSLTLAPPNGAPGASVAVSGKSFGAAETVTLTFDATVIGTVTTVSGAFNTLVTVPPGATACSHTVGAKGQSSGIAAHKTFLVTPCITLSPSLGPVGTTVKVSGAVDSVGGETINLAWDGSASPIAAATTTSTGMFSATFAVPQASARGNHIVTATGATSGAAASKTFRVGAWSATTLPNTDGDSIHGLAAVSSSNVWAVGSTATGQPLIEHYNGATWSVMAAASGVSGTLNAVAARSPTDVWAVGNGTSGTLIEHFDGTSWSAVTSANAATGQNVLSGVAAVSPSDVWAVGRSCTLCDLNDMHTLVEHWNGSQWSLVASPDPVQTYSQLVSVAAVSSTNIWAVGSYCVSCSRFGQTMHGVIEHWNGSQWTIVANPYPASCGDALASVTSVPGSKQVWAVGNSNVCTGVTDYNHTLVEHWDGASWSVVSSPNPAVGTNFLWGVVATASNNVWAVGWQQGNGTPRSTLIEHWDGTQWIVAASPNPGTLDNVLVAATRVPGSSNAWAAGTAQYSPAGAQGQDPVLLERYS